MTFFPTGSRNAASPRRRERAAQAGAQEELCAHRARLVDRRQKRWSVEQRELPAQAEPDRPAIDRQFPFVAHSVGLHTRQARFVDQKRESRRHGERCRLRRGARERGFVFRDRFGTDRAPQRHGQPGRGTAQAGALANPVTLRIANVPADVLYAGPAPGLVGVTQINARIPPATPVEGPADRISVILSTAGARQPPRGHVLGQVSGSRYRSLRRAAAASGVMSRCGVASISYPTRNLRTVAERSSGG